MRVPSLILPRRPAAAAHPEEITSGGARRPRSGRCARALPGRAVRLIAYSAYSARWSRRPPPRATPRTLPCAPCAPSAARTATESPLARPSGPARGAALRSPAAAAARGVAPRLPAMSLARAETIAAMASRGVAMAVGGWQPDRPTAPPHAAALPRRCARAGRRAKEALCCRRATDWAGGSGRGAPGARRRAQPPSERERANGSGGGG